MSIIGRASNFDKLLRIKANCYVCSSCSFAFGFYVASFKQGSLHSAFQHSVASFGSNWKYPSLVNCYVPHLLCWTQQHCLGHYFIKWFGVDIQMLGLMSCIALLGIIEPCIMPPFDSKDVYNHASCCMGANVNHFPNLLHPKQKLLQKAFQVLPLKPLVLSTGI